MNGITTYWHDTHVSSTLLLTNVTTGEIFECHFINRVGKDSRKFNVTLTAEPLPSLPDNKKGGTMIAIFVVLGIVIILLCCVLRIFYIRLKKVIIIPIIMLLGLSYIYGYNSFPFIRNGLIT